MNKNNFKPTTRMRKVFRADLITWFLAHRRDLPWRHNRTPYRVWISELMLQQTRADQALPYYKRFLKRFPDLAALAKADRADVLKLWEGLGYYSRAVRAHATARMLMTEQDGRFPENAAGLRQLPGVGSYTAAAIASLAFGEDVAVLDGNVIRVLARVLAEPAVTDAPATRARFQQWLDQLLPPGQAGNFNEAMMELGALVCTPVAPRCGGCPLADVCRAKRNGNPEAYPHRKPKKAIPHRHVGAGVIINNKGEVLIARRRDEAMLGGLWEFPGGGVEEGETLPECIARELKEELALTVRVGPPLITVRHTFSHFRMDLHAYWVRVSSGRPKALGCAEWAWVKVEAIAERALPRADQKILAALLAVEAWPRF